MTTSVPAIKPESDGIVRHLNSFVDKHVLPYPVRFLTNRIVILATLALLVPLVFYTSDQAFVNVLNSYLNVMSVVVSSTVLLYATIADIRDRAAAKRAEEIAKAYEQLLEERVQGREEIAKAYEQALQERLLGREEMTKAYEKVLEKRVLGREQELEERVQGREEIAKAYEQALQARLLDREEMSKAYEKVLEKRVLGREQELEERLLGREEIAKAYEQELEKRVQADHELIEQILQNSMDNIIGGRLEKIRLEDHKQLDDMQKAVIASNESLRKELADKALIASNESMRTELAELRELVQALHQSHFGETSDGKTSASGSSR